MQALFYIFTELEHVNMASQFSTDQWAFFNTKDFLDEIFQKFINMHF